MYMEMKIQAASQKTILQNKLRSELEALSGKTLSNSEMWEAHNNLSGFFKVLEQMKKEAYGI